MLSAAILFVMQASPVSVAAPNPDAPETWVLEYPRIIGDEIDAYYGCLKSRGVFSPSKSAPLFEEQHRAHVPLCAKQLGMSLESAKATLIGRKHYEDYTAEKIATAFRTIELIHIERGRKIDSSLARYLDQYTAYDAAYQQTPNEAGRGQTRNAVVPEASGEAKRQAITPDKPQDEVTPNAENR